MSFDPATEIDLSAQSELIGRLVSFPTVSSESNLDLIDWVADYLAGHGIESHRVFSDDGRKANLYATIGPMVEGGVVLSGHTDVVPVEGQDWSTDPFSLSVRDRRLFGRGTADMKAFSAIVLSLVPEMLTAGLTRPIHLALSYDEEVGCLGAPRMIAEMVRNLPLPHAVIVGEPTEMRVVTGHKGTFTMQTTVTGHSVHSGQVHRGVSAVAVAARLVSWLEDRMSANAASASAGSPFAPPYTTLHSGMISGGTAHNIVARHCKITSDIRPIPGENAHDYLAEYRGFIETDLVPRMRAVSADTGIEVTISADVPPLAPEVDGAAERLARQLTGDNGSHVVSFGTEGGQFQEGGYSTVVCGPGSIDQAHQPDEFIEESQVAAGTRFVRDLIARLAAG